METLASLPPESFSKSSPHLLHPEHSSLFEADHVEPLPEMGLYRLKNAQLFEDGAIFEKNRLLPQSLRDPQGMAAIYTPWRMFRRRWSYQKITLPENAVYLSLLDHWGHEYYHWHIDTLTRLELALQHLQNVTVILSERYMSRPYVRESLALFPVNIKVLPEKSYVQIPELYFCDFPGPNGYHRGSLLQALRQRMALPATSYGRRVYLSRSKARYRKVINEAEVVDYLKTKNFEVIHAENLSWTEQRKLFSQASHLVTLHGAGLTNILFMQNDAQILEIRKNAYGMLNKTERESSKLHNTYYHMCLQLGLSYSSLPSPSPTPELPSHYADVTVNIADLDALLGPRL